MIRRLCGIVEITDEQRQEQFLGGVEQQKIEGIVDEEEQEMIENVLEMSEKTAGGDYDAADRHRRNRGKQRPAERLSGQ